MRKAIYVALAISQVLLSVGTALAETEVLSRTAMSFEDCVRSIDKVSANLGVAPLLIVSTSILKVVRFPTNDGSRESILVTCSKPDGVQVINKSKN
jgi:hypothetical protein